MKFYSSEAERALAGSVLVDSKGQFWPEAREIVTADDFSSPMCKDIFLAACKLIDAGEKCDVLTIGAAAGADNNELFRLMDETPTAANAIEYAKLVHTAHVRREAAEIGERLSNLADGIDPSGELLEAQGQLSKLLAGSVGGAGLMAADEMGAAYNDFLYGQAGKPIASGFRSLDQVIGGFYPGRLYIIGARSGVGKTAFGLALAQMAARKHRVLFASLEMSAAEISGRLTASYSGVPFARAGDRSSRSEADLAAIAEGVAKQGRLKLTCLFRRGAQLTDILVAARACRAEIVFVDYIQLIRVTERLTEYERLNQVSAGLKEAAGTLGVPVVALAQLNRVAAGEAPALHHLKGSGSLEQDADVVMLLNRPWIDGPPQGTTADAMQPFQVNVAKNRHGKTWMLGLQWAAATNRFVDDVPKRWHCISWG